MVFVAEAGVKAQGGLVGCAHTQSNARHIQPGFTGAQQGAADSLATVLWVNGECGDPGQVFCPTEICGDETNQFACC